MRPSEYTPQQIIQAGLELQAAGRPVNGFSIRKQLGGGNASRLKQVWDEHNIQTPVKAEPVELPAEVAEKVVQVTQTLVERVSALAAEMNATAVQTAERRVAEVLRAAGAERDQAQHELRDAGEAVEDLEGLLDAAKANTDELETRLADTQKAEQALAVELAQVRERLLQTEQTAGRAGEAHADELARLHAATDAERTRHQAELEGTQKAIQTATLERDQTRAELAAAKAKAGAADEAHQEARKQAAAEAHRTAERVTKVQRERDEARQSAATAREDAAKLGGQVEALKEQVDNLTRALAAQKEDAK